MKKILSTCVLFLTLIGLSSVVLDAGVTFGSYDSAITIGSGAGFNVGSNNLSINAGTLCLEEGSSITGNPVGFDKGLLSSDGFLSFMKGSYDPLTANIYFQTASHLTMHDRINLSDNWIFTGINTINGHCNILDLSSGGQLILQPNATLYLTDVIVTGLGDSVGKIVMGAGARVTAANSTFKLNDNFTMNTGTFYVEGPTTFQLGSKNWTFKGAANLTVDGTTLWLDYLDSPNYMGQIYAPMPLYDGVSWNGPNLVTDLASGNLSLINRGSIKESVDASVTGFSPTPGDGGIIGDISGYHVLSQCTLVAPGKYIRVVGNATIDGRGASIKFCGGYIPQLIIMPDVTLTLSNVSLININHVTMDLRNKSKILVNKNVIWELDEDVTYSAAATIEVQAVNVFTIRGETCRRMFNINPLVNTSADNLPVKAFVLGQNTLKLESAGISGFDYMSFAPGVVAPAIALSGDAAADIDSTFYKGTDINFFVEGINNDLILRRDGLTLGGNISFGDYPDNDLHVRFNLAQNIPARSFIINDVTYNLPEGFPYVKLTGDPGIYVFSAEGLARLDFADFNAAVWNDNTNAFAVDDNSLLSCQRLALLANPVKQYSTIFRFDKLEQFGEQIDPSFVRMPLRLMPSHILLTALHMQRQKAKIEFEEAQKLAQQNNTQSSVATTQAKQKHTAKPNSKSKKKKRRSIAGLLSSEESLKNIDLDNEEKFADEATIKVLGFETIRGLNLPSSFDQPTYVQTVYEPTTPIVGNLEFDRAVIRNFKVSPDVAFNIVIRNTTSAQQGTVIELGEDTVLTSNHKINVRGTGNIIKLTHNLTIGLDNIYIEEGAELTFLFPDDAVQKTLFITANTLLSIPREALIRFSGPGKVIFGANTEINFEGIKTVNAIKELVSARSYLQITNDVQVLVAANSQLRMTGIGEIGIFNRGRIALDQSGSKIIIGSDEAKVDGACAEDVNDFIVDVRDGGEVNITDATFAFHYVTSRIHFNNGGSLFVDEYGIFQINSNIEGALPSMLKELDMGIGVFTLRENGIFAIGPNKNNSKVGGEYTFLYNAIQAMISGELHPGSVFYLGAGAFGGRLCPSPQATERYSNQTALDLVRYLVNRNNKLKASIYYLGEDDKYYVRTINGAIVQLGTYDVITDDTADGYIHGDNTATGKNFTIKPDGTRVNA